MNQNNTFQLGRSLTKVIPFYRTPIKKQQKGDYFTIVIAIIVVLVKISILALWF